MNKKLITLYFMCFYVACNSTPSAQHSTTGETPSTNPTPVTPAPTPTPVANTFPPTQNQALAANTPTQNQAPVVNTPTQNQILVAKTSPPGQISSPPTQLDPRFSHTQKCEAFENCKSIFVYKKNGKILEEFIVLESHVQDSTYNPAQDTASFFFQSYIVVFQKKDYSQGISQLRNMTKLNAKDIKKNFCENETKLDLVNYMMSDFLPVGSVTLIDHENKKMENIFPLPSNNIAQPSKVMDFTKKEGGLFETITFIDRRGKKYTISKHQEISPIYDVSLYLTTSLYKNAKSISKFDDLLRRKQRGDPLDEEIKTTELCTNIDIS